MEPAAERDGADPQSQMAELSEEAHMAAQVEEVKRKAGLPEMQPSFAAQAAEAYLIEEAERFLLAAMPAHTPTLSDAEPMHGPDVGHAPSDVPSLAPLEAPSEASSTTPKEPDRRLATSSGLPPLLEEMASVLGIPPPAPGSHDQDSEESGASPKVETELDILPPLYNEVSSTARRAGKEPEVQLEPPRAQPSPKRPTPERPTAERPKPKVQIRPPEEEEQEELLRLPEKQRKARRIELLTEAEEEAEANRRVHEKMAYLRAFDTQLSEERTQPEQLVFVEEPFAGPNIQWDEEVADDQDSPKMSEEEQRRADMQERLLTGLQEKLRNLPQRVISEENALPRFANKVHKEVLQRGPTDEIPKKALDEFSRAFSNPDLPAEERRLVFYAFNELCRLLCKDPDSRLSQYVRHAGWSFLKAVTAVDLTDKERHHYIRFLRKHSSKADDPSWILRAAGTSSSSKEVKLWHNKLQRWELAMKGKEALAPRDQYGSGDKAKSCPNASILYPCNI